MLGTANTLQLCGTAPPLVTSKQLLSIKHPYLRGCDKILDDILATKQPEVIRLLKFSHFLPLAPSACQEIHALAQLQTVGLLAFSDIWSPLPFHPLASATVTGKAASPFSPLPCLAQQWCPQVHIPRERIDFVIIRRHI